MPEMSMGWLDWTLMYGFYAALLAVVVGAVVLLVRGGRGGPGGNSRR